MINGFDKGCDCNKCRIKRTLTIELWNSDKITFISIYKHFSYFSRESLIEALSDKVYDEMRDSLDKYMVLI
jgi:hypothetical protein